MMRKRKTGSKRRRKGGMARVNQRRNLARPGYIGRFDCILCMDVLPHFSRAQRNALLERLHLYLEPGGYLFLSQTEKLGSTNLNFRSETFDGYTFHRKPLAASAAYGR